MPTRKFVPSSLKYDDFSEIAPLFDALSARPLASAAEVEAWLLDLSELSSVLDEHGSRLYIAKCCHTDDPDIAAKFLHWIEKVEPEIQKAFFAQQSRASSVGALAQLRRTGAGVLQKRWQAEVELFREENVALSAQATAKIADYDKLCGAMLITHGGKELTLQQAGAFLEETDRPMRESIFRKIAERRLQDRKAMDVLYDELGSIRRQMAANAGQQNYRDFVWKSYKRFDYSPGQCLALGDAIAETVVPLVREMDARRAKAMGLERLRPWDTSVDARGREPLRPFSASDPGAMVEGVREILRRISPDLSDPFSQLITHGNLDLQSRKGKRSGGFQCSLEESRQPFIFMNAAGLQRDIETLLHEAGHAFHHLLAAGEDVVFLRSAPMEFCEVASMTMELIGLDQMGVFYSPEDACRAKRSQLEGVIRLLPWVATIDGFQHWAWTHPNHTPEERTGQWLSIHQRYSGETDWSGLEDARQCLWQRQLHLYHAPFYYIEYAIAQLGALQIWQRYRRNPGDAMAGYRAALSLGGTRPLPELFEAAGIRFDFSPAMLASLVSDLRAELDQLPD